MINEWLILSFFLMFNYLRAHFAAAKHKLISIQGSLLQTSTTFKRTVHPNFPDAALDNTVELPTHFKANIGTILKLVLIFHAKHT